MKLDDLLEMEVFALTIYGEARGEPVEGQIAVANVVMNRLRSNPLKYPDIREVCLAPRQFSCWNFNDPNREKLLEVADQFRGENITDSYLRQAYYIAKGAKEFMWVDNTNKSLNYLTVDLFHSNKRPKWAMVPKNDPMKIGNHVFFTA